MVLLHLLAHDFLKTFILDDDCQNHGQFIFIVNWAKLFYKESLGNEIL